jgi:alkylation response protein AidB-like acyl-CoA dehydrogenase
MAFAITEPDAGSNSHNITTTARATATSGCSTAEDLHLGRRRGRQRAGRRRTEDAKTGKLKPCLFVVPTDARASRPAGHPDGDRQPGEAVQLFIDDVRLPADALVGDEDGGLVQLFAGLNPERIMGASFSTRPGPLRARQGGGVRQGARRSWKDAPIGAHQGIAHPLAKAQIEIELARLMSRRPPRSTTPATTWARARPPTWPSTPPPRPPATPPTVAVQTHGGNGITQEYGMAGLLVATRAGRIAPVSREMILNFVAMHSLGLPKSY